MHKFSNQYQQQYNQSSQWSQIEIPIQLLNPSQNHNHNHKYYHNYKHYHSTSLNTKFQQFQPSNQSLSSTTTLFDTSNETAAAITKKSTRKVKAIPTSTTIEIAPIQSLESESMHLNYQNLQYLQPRNKQENDVFVEKQQFLQGHHYKQCRVQQQRQFDADNFANFNHDKDNRCSRNAHFNDQQQPQHNFFQKRNKRKLNANINNAHNHLQQPQYDPHQGLDYVSTIKYNQLKKKSNYQEVSELEKSLKMLIKGVNYNQDQSAMKQNRTEHSLLVSTAVTSTSVADKILKMIIPKKQKQTNPLIRNIQKSVTTAAATRGGILCTKGKSRSRSISTALVARQKRKCRTQQSQSLSTGISRVMAAATACSNTRPTKMTSYQTEGVMKTQLLHPSRSQSQSQTRARTNSKNSSIINNTTYHYHNPLSIHRSLKQSMESNESVYDATYEPFTQNSQKQQHFCMYQDQYKQIQNEILAFNGNEEKQQDRSCNKIVENNIKNNRYHQNDIRQSNIKKSHQNVNVNQKFVAQKAFVDDDEIEVSNNSMMQVISNRLSANQKKKNNQQSYQQQELQNCCQEQITAALVPAQQQKQGQHSKEIFKENQRCQLMQQKQNEEEERQVSNDNDNDDYDNENILIAAPVPVTATKPSLKCDLASSFSCSCSYCNFQSSSHRELKQFQYQQEPKRTATATICQSSHGQSYYFSSKLRPYQQRLSYYNPNVTFISRKSDVLIAKKVDFSKRNNMMMGVGEQNQQIQTLKSQKPEAPKQRNSKSKSSNGCYQCPHKHQQYQQQYYHCTCYCGNCHQLQKSQKPQQNPNQQQHFSDLISEYLKSKQKKSDAADRAVDRNIGSGFNRSLSHILVEQKRGKRKRKFDNSHKCNNNSLLMISGSGPVSGSAPSQMYGKYWGLKKPYSVSCITNKGFRKKTVS